MTVETQDFFTWVHSVTSGADFQQLCVYLMAGGLGILAHYVKKLLDKDISGSFWNYLFGQYPGRTITALSTFVGTGATYVYTGSADGMTWPALIGLAFSTGYMVDSSINKAAKPNVD